MLGLRMGIDFGSATLNICIEGKGTVLSEPSVMLCDAASGKPLAMGAAAVETVGRTPSSLKTVNPIRDGIVSNFETAQQLLRPYITRLCGNRIWKPNAVVCVPSSVSPVEKRMLLSILADCGVGRACFIDRPLAAAVGAGVNAAQAGGTLCVEMGAGAVDAALLSMGSVVASAFSRQGGNALTEAVRAYLAHAKHVEVGFLTAEDTKKTVGTAVLRKEELAVLVNGKNTKTGLPETVEVTSTELYWVLKSGIESVLATIRSVLEQAPVELLSDVMENGMLLTGGGARLYGLANYLEKNAGVPVRMAPEPETAVVRGLNAVLKDFGSLVKDEYVYLSGVEGSNDIPSSEDT